MRINPIKIDLAKRYVELLKSVFGDNLVSVFLFGSVVRGEDTQLSDIDLMAILKEPPTIHQLRILGEPGRFTEIRGIGEFQEISCAVNTQDRFLKFIREGAPREGVNPLREAVVLYDTGFISDLKKKLETGDISLKKDAFCDYLRYGDIRLFCLIESTVDKNTRNARSDAAAAASHYLRAYFLYKYNEMILSKVLLRKRIREEDHTIAILYDKIMEGDYSMDLVNKIIAWTIENIGAAKEECGRFSN